MLHNKNRLYNQVSMEEIWFSSGFKLRGNILAKTWLPFWLIEHMSNSICFIKAVKLLEALYRLMNIQIKIAG